MASILASATQAAHSAAAGLLSKAHVTPGSTLPAGVHVKEDAPDKTFELALTGKNVIVGVPAAFSAPCSNQVPGYVEHLEAFKAKGVSAIYVVAVNDAFVMK